MAGKKDVNTELNITSMIDLMSVLVAFLLLSAVWVQISALPASVDSKGRAPSSSTPPENNRLTVHVTSTGIRMTWPPGAKGPGFINKTKEGYDLTKVTSAIEAVIATGKSLTASVSGDNNVEYGLVAESVDAVKAGKVSSVSLMTN